MMTVHFVRKMSEMSVRDLASVIHAFAPEVIAELSEPELSEVERALLLAEKVGCPRDEASVDTASE
jgi:hypothetical protein